ncbi:MAG: TPM domain-containing protein [Lachnospiraceae bacterium]|nr:TPM domain-containing protein [Lachnospiraceae bacterium]
MRKRVISAVLAFVLALLLVPVFGAKADTLEDSLLYTNSDTGYSVYIWDKADLLSDSDEQSLLTEMRGATAYGNLIFVSTNESSDGTSTLGHSIIASLGYAQTTVLIINMGMRELWIETNSDRLTVAKAQSITDNNYIYATNGDYYGFVLNSTQQIKKVLAGARIAEPMKYICNALFSVVVALFICIIIVKITTAHSKPSTNELFENLSKGYLDTSALDSQHTRTERHYSPQSDSSSGGSHGGGGHSGGGGGGGGGGSHGGGHSF